MLNKNSIKEGYKLSKSLNERGETFFIKKGSLVDELIKKTLDGISVNSETPTASELIESLTQVGNETDDDHDAVMNNYVNDIADKTSKMIHHTVNVVGKEAMRLFQKFKELDGDEGIGYNTNFYDVSFMVLPELANTPFVHEILESVNESEVGYKRTEMPNLSEVLQTVSPDSKETLNMGIDYVDSCIETWLNESELLKGYLGETGNICRIIEDTYKLTDEAIVRRTAKDYRFNTLDFALVNLLFYRKISMLRDDAGEYIKGVTVPAHNNFRFWSYVVKKRLISYRKAIAEGRVISPTGTDPDLISVLKDTNIRNKKVVCYSESIRKMADRTVDITSLFGFIFNGGDYFSVTVDELTVDKDRYSNIWYSKVSNLQYIRKQSMIAKTKWNLKKAYSACFKESLKEGNENGVFDGDDESVKIDYIGDLDKDGVSNKVSNYIDSLRSDKQLIVMEVCIEIIAGIRYSNYPAKRYLTLFMKDDGGFEFSEPGLREISADYIATFLLDNVEIGEQ